MRSSLSGMTPRAPIATLPDCHPPLARNACADLRWSHSTCSHMVHQGPDSRITFLSGSGSTITLSLWEREGEGKGKGKGSPTSCLPSSEAKGQWRGSEEGEARGVVDRSILGTRQHVHQPRHGQGNALQSGAKTTRRQAGGSAEINPYNPPARVRQSPQSAREGRGIPRPSRFTGCVRGKPRARDGVASRRTAPKTPSRTAAASVSAGAWQVAEE